MAAQPPVISATVEQLAGFDALIDVRSPAEFAEDHIPGAANFPVLDNEERARVGTMYQQDSPFSARKFGAALVARNIAKHLERDFHRHPKHWTPLVYCWRGGQRSGSMATVLAQIGWTVSQLEGGYKAYRRKVIADLAVLPARYEFIVLHGPTGSGKTALLEALCTSGGQVLNLEALAQHRGSVLGASMLGDSAPDLQPGQKAFETQIREALNTCNPARPVYVESESRRIGKLSIPGVLFDALIASRCLRIVAPLEARVAHLLERYGDVYRHPQTLRSRLEFFVAQHGKNAVEHWQQLVDAGRFGELAEAIVRAHYDPAYRRGGDSLYRHAHEAQVLELGSLDSNAIIGAAHAILHNSGNRHAD
jgi:tRNA 2-selenouridine synthase